MNRDNQRQKQFTRRAVLLGGAKLAAFGALVARMYYLGVVESDKYKTLAEDNRISLRLLAPPRGRILDRFGETLAINELNYRLVVIPEQTASVPVTLDVLSEIVPISDVDRRRILRDMTRKRRFVPIQVRDHLSWEDVARIAVNTHDLPGVMIEVGSTRSYPHGSLLSHIIGYVAPPAESDLTGDPLLELPDIRIGRNGIERSFDIALRGRAGTSQIEVNALGRPIRELAREEGERGHDVVLTLDLELQRLASERLAKEESAAAVMLDARDGGVLVLSSSPSYEPNEFSKGISGATWRQLLSDSRGPLTNKAIAGQYSPGSTFKMMVAIAALEAGVANAQTRVSCPGHYQLGDTKFHCWKKGGHGGVDLNEALKQSCDVYFYEIARRVGVDKIADVCMRFGLGKNTGIDLPGEKPGLIPTRAWKQGATGVAWQQGETLVAGIGQGFVLTTPLQLAVMTARLVNGGMAVVPHLTRDRITGRRIDDRPESEWPSMGVSPEILGLMVRGMNGVVNDPRGTAFRSRFSEKQWAFGGKTGTSQVRRITAEERIRGLRKPHEIPWKERDHALFVGYAPIENPIYAMAVIVEHGGGGSTVAAPIARDLLRAALLRGREGREPVARVAGGEPGKRL